MAYKAPTLQIIVDVPNQLYYPSGLVEGVVYVLAEKPVCLTSLKLCVKGAQRAKKQIADKSIKGTNTFLSHTADLDHGPVTLQGPHRYPFSFILPKNIPASFKVPDVPSRVGYKVLCKAKRSDGGVAIGKAKFLVGMAPSLSPSPSSYLECESEIKFCCGEGGVTKLIAGCDRSSCSLNDTVTVSCSADNSRGTIDIVRFGVVLTHQVRTVFGAGPARTRGFSTECRVPKGENNLQKPCQIQVTFDPEAGPSTKATMLKSAYRLNVYVQFDSACGTSDSMPTVLIPIKVSAALPPPIVAQSVPPPNACQTHPDTTLVINTVLYEALFEAQKASLVLALTQQTQALKQVRAQAEGNLPLTRLEPLPVLPSDSARPLQLPAPLAPPPVPVPVTVLPAPPPASK
jgi:hypothetical protein